MALFKKTKECAGAMDCRLKAAILVAVALNIIGIVAILLFHD